MTDSKASPADLEELCRAMATLNTPLEIRQFLEDLCSASELNAMAQRYLVARLLQEKVRCQDIARQTGSSTATISRVNRCLHRGSGGYRIVLERAEQERGIHDGPE